MCAMYYSNPKLMRSFIITFNEELMSEFVDNPKVGSCAVKTNCEVTLSNRILNRAVRPGCWDRYFIVHVAGKDQFAIDRCNRLLERTLPQYLLRKPYKCKTNMTLYTNEWMPDNTPLSNTSFRSGCLRSQYGSLSIQSPLASTILRPKLDTPWKITHREIMGHYQTSDTFDRIYINTKKSNFEERFENNVTHKEISYFNLPNSFDRYTTFKAIDNEHINVKLQNRCRQFLDALRNDHDRPSSMKVGLDPRSSVTHSFAQYENRLQSLKSQKIPTNDIRGSIQAFSHNKNSRVNINPIPDRGTASHLEPKTFDPIANAPIPEDGEVSFDDEEEPDSKNQNQNQFSIKNKIILPYKNQNSILANSNDTFLKMMRQKYSKKYYRKYSWRTKRKTVKFKEKSLNTNTGETNNLKYYRKENNWTKKLYDNMCELNSQVTSLSSNCPSHNENNSNAPTKASKSSNFDDNTLDSLKSI